MARSGIAGILQPDLEAQGLVVCWFVFSWPWCQAWSLDVLLLAQVSGSSWGPGVFLRPYTRTYAQCSMLSLAMKWCCPPHLGWVTPP